MSTIIFLFAASKLQINLAGFQTAQWLMSTLMSVRSFFSYGYNDTFLWYRLWFYKDEHCAVYYAYSISQSTRS